MEKKWKIRRKLWFSKGWHPTSDLENVFFEGEGVGGGWGATYRLPKGVEFRRQPEAGGRGSTSASQEEKEEKVRGMSRSWVWDALKNFMP